MLEVKTLKHIIKVTVPLGGLTLCLINLLKTL